MKSLSAVGATPFVYEDNKRIPLSAVGATPFVE